MPVPNISDKRAESLSFVKLLYEVCLFVKFLGFSAWSKSLTTSSTSSLIISFSLILGVSTFVETLALILSFL